MQLLPDPPGQAQTQPAKPTRFAGGLRVMSAEIASCDFGQSDHGAIAQLGERLVCNQKVAGSIPAGSTSSLPPAVRDTRDDASSCEPLKRSAPATVTRSEGVRTWAGVIARSVA